MTISKLLMTAKSFLTWLRSEEKQPTCASDSQLEATKQLKEDERVIDNQVKPEKKRGRPVGWRKENATEEGEKRKSNKRKHKKRDATREKTKASDSDSPPKSRKKEKVEQM